MRFALQVAPRSFVNILSGEADYRIRKDGEIGPGAKAVERILGGRVSGKVQKVSRA